METDVPVDDAPKTPTSIEQAAGLAEQNDPIQPDPVSTIDQGDPQLESEEVDTSGVRRRKLRNTEQPDTKDETLDSPRDTELVEKSNASNSASDESKKALRGITNEGESFVMPRTKNPLAFYSPTQWSLFDWLKNASALNFLWLLFTGNKFFYILLFLFWRLAYNLGLGYLLHKQSNGRHMVRWYRKIIYAAEPKDSNSINNNNNNSINSNNNNREREKSAWYPLVAQLLKLGMKDDYKFEEMPDSFNAWLAFRHLVDIVLANDLMCYVVFCVACFEWPERFTLSLIVCYLVGLFLGGFTLWAKTDAYRVVKDFAWYWGDFFFLVDQQLTFDRVFSISPHPMYTIGYSFFYGASLITQSYTVLYVSLIGHFCQLGFLAWVENPHIDKTYPGAVKPQDAGHDKILYDMKTGYFRKDLIVFKNLDLFRSSDLFMIVIIFYCFLLNLLNLPPTFYVAQAILWRVIHSFVLGSVMRLQSSSNFWTHHFLSRGFTKVDAFDSWKRIYNLSLVMTHVAFFCCALKFAELPDASSDYLYGSFLLKQTGGLLLLALNVWSSVSVFEVLGEFGWFYGDFFIDEVPSTLYYTGIYRFVNNPDQVTGFAGYYGLAIMSDSWTIFALALFSQAAGFWFIHAVEEPHMKKLYGSSVRSKSGVVQAVSAIVNEAVEKSPQLLKIKKSASEMEVKLKGKVTENTEKVKVKVSEVTLKVKEKGEKWKGKVQEITDTVTEAGQRLSQQAEQVLPVQQARDFFC